MHDQDDYEEAGEHDLAVDHPIKEDGKPPINAVPQPAPPTTPAENKDPCNCPFHRRTRSQT